MQDNYNYSKKNILLYKTKLKKPAKPLRLKEHKWFKLLRSNSTWCQSQ